MTQKSATKSTKKPPHGPIAASPHTWPKSKPSLRRSRSAGTPDSDSRRPPTRSIPYLGLTQACSVIRSEFCPLHLTTHRFPLFALDGYLKAFHPPATPAANAEQSKRNFNTAPTTFRILVNKNDLDDCDVIKLLKHRHRFPSLTITLEPGSEMSPDVLPDMLPSLHVLLSNTNKTWTHWLKSNTVTQVRLATSNVHTPRLRIVIKERNAAPWMRKLSAPDPPFVGEFLEGLELEDIEWKVTFGVDYS